MSELQEWLRMDWPADGIVTFQPDPETPGQYQIVIEGVGAPPPLTTETDVTVTVENGVLVIRGIRFE